MNKTKLYAKALEKWGELAQILVAIEEMSELTKELCKLDRCPDKLAKEIVVCKIADEIADVEIMMEQLKMIYHINESVAERKEVKLLRLEKMLEMGQ